MFLKLDLDLLAGKRKLQFTVMLFISILILTPYLPIFSGMVLGLGPEKTLKHICCFQKVMDD